MLKSQIPHTVLSPKLRLRRTHYRAEFHFMPGWIALRFLSDPITAIRHFGKIDEGSRDPIVLARAAYWRGRAFEAAGQFDEMKARTRWPPTIRPLITGN